ncbi:hypothetical protein HK098_006570, partial [Nowakowskiella sp. JEL0407]
HWLPCISTCDEHQDSVVAVAISSDGKYIVSGSGDKTAKILSAKTEKEIQTLAGHSVEVNAVAINSDGSLVVTGSGDNFVMIWNAATGKEEHVFERAPNWWNQLQ